MKITLYSTSTCPYCKMLKDHLEALHTSFRERLVDQDDDAREEMMKESGGFLGVPFTVIEKDEMKETVVGFDKARIDKLLSS